MPAMRLAIMALVTALLAPSIALAQVVATDYDAFWLWGGLASVPAVAQARTLYVLQGEIHADHRKGTVDILAQGIAVPRLRDGAIWLVYRANTLDWPDRAVDVLNAQVARWRQAGNNIVGVQIDFDAATRHLDTYAAFLQELRRGLLPNCRLGITGLLDWSSKIEPATLDQLRGVVDELVIQTYQGRQTIPNYAAYLSHLGRLHLPFKIGLVESGEWIEDPGIVANPWFRGYVVFLVNRN